MDHDNDLGSRQEKTKEREGGFLLNKLDDVTGGGRGSRKFAFEIFLHYPRSSFLLVSETLVSQDDVWSFNKLEKLVVKE